MSSACELLGLNLLSFTFLGFEFVYLSGQLEFFRTVGTFCCLGIKVLSSHQCIQQINQPQLISLQMKISWCIYLLFSRVLTFWSVWIFPETTISFHMYICTYSFKVGTHQATSRSNRSLGQVALYILQQKKSLPQGNCLLHMQRILKNGNVTSFPI